MMSAEYELCVVTIILYFNVHNISAIIFEALYLISYHIIKNKEIDSDSVKSWSTTQSPKHFCWALYVEGGSKICTQRKWLSDKMRNKKCTDPCAEKEKSEEMGNSVEICINSISPMINRHRMFDCVMNP